MILAVMVAAGALLALGNAFYLLDFQPDVASRRGWGPSAQVMDVSSPASSGRLIYSHSVIPGGVWDGQELMRAVTRDPVVAEHYRDVDPATMRPRILTSDRVAYVSYRVGDRVYWTSRTVRIRSGETILTNGQTEIRARCGNCISMAPLMPTSADEPDPLQLDALTDIGPTLVSWDLTPFRPLLTAGVPVEDDDGNEALFAPLLLFPLDPFGGSVVPGGSGPDVPNGGLPDSPPPVTLPDSPPPVGSIPPSPPGGGGVAGDSPELEPLVLAALSDGATAPVSSPSLTPVPEPGTLLLFGSGVALLVARYRASKKN